MSIFSVLFYSVCLSICLYLFLYLYHLSSLPLPPLPSHSIPLPLKTPLFPSLSYPFRPRPSHSPQPCSLSQPFHPSLSLSTQPFSLLPHSPSVPLHPFQHKTHPPFIHLHPSHPSHTISHDLISSTLSIVKHPSLRFISLPHSYAQAGTKPFHPSFLPSFVLCGRLGRLGRVVVLCVHRWNRGKDSSHLAW